MRQLSARSSSTSSGARSAGGLVRGERNLVHKLQMHRDGWTKGGPRPNHNLARERMGERRAVVSSQRFAAAWRTPDLSDPEELPRRQVP